MMLIFGSVHEKTNNFGFRPGSTQTGLYSQRRWLETGSFGFIKVEEFYYPYSKNKGADQICAFVFAYADCWFSHAAAHFVSLII